VFLFLVLQQSPNLAPIFRPIVKFNKNANANIKNKALIIVKLLPALDRISAGKLPSKLN